MSIVKNGEYVAKEIFDGRNSEWFDNLQGNGWDDVYDTLPAEHGVYHASPMEVIKDSQEKYYYGFRYISVKNMFNWLEHYKPWIDGGWASEYEKWNYNFRGIVPEEGFPRFKPEDTNEPYYFIQYEKKHERSKWLYIYLLDKYERNIPEDEYLIYYFDC